MISTNYARRAIIMSNIIDLQEFRFTKQTIYTIIFIYVCLVTTYPCKILKSFTNMVIPAYLVDIIEVFR